jgi:hypothetical protein
MSQQLDVTVGEFYGRWMSQLLDVTGGGCYSSWILWAPCTRFEMMFPVNVPAYSPFDTVRPPLKADCIPAIVVTLGYFQRHSQGRHIQ